MKNKFKEDLLEVLKNLRCIDSTGDLQVDSYVYESIEILKKIINDIETAPEVPVQEQWWEKVKLGFAEEMANYVATRGRVQEDLK